MNDKITAFKDKLFAAANKKGFADCEIYMSGNDSFSVRVYNGEILEYKNAGGSGLSFRGTYNGKVGYAFSEKISDDVIPFLVENAMQNAGIIEDPEKEQLYPGDKVYPEVKTFEPLLEKVSISEKIDSAIMLEKTAFDTDMRVAGVDYCIVQSGTGNTYIANSLGLEVSKKSNYAGCYVNVRVTENEQTKMEDEEWVGRDWKEFNPTAVAREAVRKAVSLLGAKQVPTGKYDVIFEAEEASSLLRTFWSVFDADRVQKGFSLLKGKLGAKIAASHVTIRDDALLPLKAGSRPFDDEGVATCDKVVVENGVLKTFLHNTKTALKEGVPPTGNGSKASYKATLGISPNNFYIVPGSCTKDELIGKMKNGLIITELAGLHSGTNPVSGDFSLLAGGFLVKDGKAAGPVEQITVAGNFFEMLNNIAEAADDLNLERTNIASPSLWVRGINVSGE